jgi:hypothetical protein
VVVKEFEILILFKNSIQIYSVDEKLELKLTENLKFDNFSLLDENLNFFVDKMSNLKNLKSLQLGNLTKTPSLIKSFKNFVSIAFNEVLTLWDSENFIILKEIKFNSQINVNHTPFKSFQFIHYADQQMFVQLENLETFKFSFLFEKLTTSMILKLNKPQEYLSKNVEKLSFNVEKNEVSPLKTENDALVLLKKQNWGELKELLMTKKISSKEIPLIETLIEKEKIVKNYFLIEFVGFIDLLF